jgi:hypothetical protein
MHAVTASKEVWAASLICEDDWTALVTYPCSCGEKHTSPIGVDFQSKDFIYCTFRRHPKFACGVETRVLLTGLPTGPRKIALQTDRLRHLTELRELRERARREERS